MLQPLGLISSLRIHLGRTASRDHAFVGIESDDRNGLYLGAIERQHALLVLQQNRALLRKGSGNFESAFHIDHALLRGVVHNAAEEFGTQDAAHMLIELSHRDFARLHCRFKLGAEEVVERLFIVESGVRGFHRAVGSSPVGEHEARDTSSFL